MVIKRKSKTNNTTFMDIPKPLDKAKETMSILAKLKRKQNMQEERTKKVQERRDISKEIYNLSIAMTKIDTDIYIMMQNEIFNEVANGKSI